MTVRVAIALSPRSSHMQPFGCLPLRWTGVVCYSAHVLPVSGRRVRTAILRAQHTVYCTAAYQYCTDLYDQNTPYTSYQRKRREPRPAHAQRYSTAAMRRTT